MPDPDERRRFRLPWRKRPWRWGQVQLTDEQQLILGLLLVVLLAVSMLYCLGFASLAVRENWEQAPLPWNGTVPAEVAPASPGAGLIPGSASP